MVFRALLIAHVLAQ